jgi:predicted regulator of Ras-like GTPase activity (Roadblock/LC7/MglB family)
VVVPTTDEPTTDGSLDVSKQQELHEVLRGFHDAVDGVQGAVLATRDGLPVVSTLTDARAETVAAMAATVVALADQAMPASADSGVAGADGSHTVIRGTDGCLVVYAAGDQGVLAVQTTAQPNIGLVHVEAPAAARELAGLLG